MSSMPIGMITLIVVAVLIFFGVAQRILDRMRLTDKQALAYIVLTIIGSFITIPIVSGPLAVTVNIGGAVLPMLLVGYLFFRAGSAKEQIRAVIASVLAGAVVAIIPRITPIQEPSGFFMDPTYFYAIVSGLVAYLVGRSRRSAFIAGTMGIIIGDFVHWFQMANAGLPGRADLGGAGAFDATVIAGIVAVMIAELIGETRERLQGGPSHHHPDALEKGLNTKFELNTKQENTQATDAKEAGERRE
jgi:uncharacterized membrane protein